MNPSEPSVPVSATRGFRVLVWISIFALLLIIAWLVMIYVVPPPSGTRSWIYPGAKEIAVSTAQPIELRVLSTADGFQTVANWYNARAATGSGDPAFMSSAGPLGGARSVSKVSLPAAQSVRGSLFSERTRRGVTLAMVSRSDGDPATFITAVNMGGGFVNDRSGPGGASSALKAMAYPGARSKSGGAGGASSAFQYTSADQPEKIMAHFLEWFGAPPVLALAAGQSTNIGPASAQNLLTRLPEPSHTGVDQRSLLFLTPTNLCLIHLARATNAAETAMILSVTSR